MSCETIVITAGGNYTADVILLNPAMVNCTSAPNITLHDIRPESDPLENLCPCLWERLPGLSWLLPRRAARTFAS